MPRRGGPSRAPHGCGRRRARRRGGRRSGRWVPRRRGPLPHRQMSRRPDGSRCGPRPRGPRVGFGGDLEGRWRAGWPGSGPLGHAPGRARFGRLHRPQPGLGPGREPPARGAGKMTRRRRLRPRRHALRHGPGGPLARCRPRDPLRPAKARSGLGGSAPAPTSRGRTARTTRDGSAGRLGLDGGLLPALSGLRRLDLRGWGRLVVTALSRSSRAHIPIWLCFPQVSLGLMSLKRPLPPVAARASGSRAPLARPHHPQCRA